MKKIMKKSVAVFCLLAVVVTLGACNKKADDRAESDINWQLISADDLKEAIDQGESYQIIDIQPEADFAKGHVPDSVSVPAYPVDTAELEKLVSDAVPDFADGDDPIYVMCLGGGSGAKRTISIMQEEGVAPERLYIIEKGAKGWPHKELWVTD
ncbi:rhodanese-like domain-containing protein [Vagococcus allomyrinae]|nr:rhodanese-like domain-containing protein [Vagococcus allomyrinae]